MNNGGPRPGLALALSGGGFRATLFHLGALWRLNELGYLQKKKLTRVTSVSGGSIIAGVLGHRYNRLNFDGSGVAGNFVEEIATSLQSMCSRTIDVPSILSGWLSIFKTPIDLLDKRYRRYLFGKATLQDLPTDKEGPRFIIYATSFQTGASVRFSKPYMAEYHLGQILDPEILLSTAVTASSAFPPVLTPVIINLDPTAWQQTPGADLYHHVPLRAKMYLSDGGVYDNLGLEAAWNFETVLVSDAGAPFGIETNPVILKLSQVKKTLRVLDIAIDQTRALRRRRVMEDYTNGTRKGTYWGIATKIDDYGLSDPMVKDNDRTRSMKRIHTRLCKFSEELKGYLINWGYALADAAMRRWVLAPGAPKGSWPVPRYPLD